jgi:hypothetical protein
MNLLQETIQILKDHDKAPSDIHWIGIGDSWFSWDDFQALADIEYDNGFGGIEIAEDLVIVGGNWWMTRDEYDGAEGWEFHTRPSRKGMAFRVPSRLTIKEAETREQR